MRRVVRTFWVRPVDRDRALPPAGPRMRAVFSAFLDYFPEYRGCLNFSQSPRRPRFLFVYVWGCRGLLPEAAAHLERLLRAAFPGGEVRAYGPPFKERSEG